MGPELVYRSVLDVARAPPNLPAFRNIFRVTTGHPTCVATPQLSAKYGVAQQNQQTVVSITDQVSGSQAWYNAARTRKPQTFVGEPVLADPTGGGGPGTCDFCDWRRLTAEDPWGRVELRHAVTASNLFKYCEPAQGVVLFKHHDPLAFSLEQLSDLVEASRRWLLRAAAAQQDAGGGGGATAEPGTSSGPREGRRRELHPLLVWNCLPRAGASQFHGHAQVMLSGAAFPTLRALCESAGRYGSAHGGRSYWHDVREAHGALGLLRTVPPPDGSGGPAWVYACVSPAKDMELVVHGRSMADAAFVRAFYAALRALVDELGVRTFNAAVHGIDLAAEAALEPGRSRDGGSEEAGAGPAAPVVARVVSRGRLGNQASDFGGLEVFGGAAIGHTDPFRVAAALDAALSAL